MARKAKKRPGPPARYGRRPTLTIRLQEPLYRAIKKNAAEHGKSLSEEIEDQLSTLGDLETARRELEQMRAITTKEYAMAASVLKDVGEVRSAARVQAIRAAGLQILREIEGRPTRVIVELETLLAEADGLAGGLRSGFFAGETPPAPEALRPMTAEEGERLMRELEEIKQSLKTAVEKTLAADAAEEAATAAKDDDEAA
jgi:hypothetical protein